MNEIAKSHENVSDARRLTPDAAVPLEALAQRIAHEIEAQGLHAGRVLVVLPFVQLIAPLRQAWGRVRPSGFVPRMETTRSWARSLGGFEPDSSDISFDAARDGLSARAWLERAGLAGERDALASRLVEAARMLAGAAAAVPPGERAAWAARASAVVAIGQDNPALQIEAHVARVAVSWAGASAYETDVLFGPRAGAGLDALVVVGGLQPDPVTDAVAARFEARAMRVELDAPGIGAAPRLHRARDPEDEAELAAACVLRRVEAGQVPVALAAIDRGLTRRVRAMLDAAGVALRDETGWKLSTTRAAAHLMSLLRAAAHDASADVVLDWLKNAPAFQAFAVDALESLLRREGVGPWRAATRAVEAPRTAPEVLALVETAQAVREPLQRARPLAAWLDALRASLHAAGQWSVLEADAAGSDVLAALRLNDPGASEDFAAFLAATPYATRRLHPGQFIAWVDEVLEAATFRPQAPDDAPVVILPLHQVALRPFAAAVLPACDEIRLPAVPEPEGPWTPAQRAALALPTREIARLAQRAAWRWALALPQLDVLWRTADAGGEPVLASPLVQELLLEGSAARADDPRALREVALAPVSPPAARGDALPVAQLSASAYEDLRRCPYRFFALRQLGLRESDELDAEVDKRDFGTWLHAVLGRFHETLQDVPGLAATADRVALLDAAAEAVTLSMRLEDSEFLPFRAAWPATRDGYLHWLSAHEAAGARFRAAEQDSRQALGSLTLVGRLDRIDVDADGRTLLLDYKTEALQRSRDRIRVPEEDTQLAFYAALRDEDTLRAAYVNVGERGQTTTVEQTGVVEARDALIEGILHDMTRIADGAPMRALGEGSACEHCAARGLCRKDFWTS